MMVSHFQDFNKRIIILSYMLFTVIPKSRPSIEEWGTSFKVTKLDILLMIIRWSPKVICPFWMKNWLRRESKIKFLFYCRAIFPCDEYMAECKCGRSSGPCKLWDLSSCWWATKMSGPTKCRAKPATQDTPKIKNHWKTQWVMAQQTLLQHYSFVESTSLGDEKNLSHLSRSASPL